MASWKEVVAHVRGRQPQMTESRSGSLELSFGAQSVLIRSMDLRGAKRVMVLADVCPARVVPLGLVVTLNRDLITGSLIVVGDLLAIRHVLALATLSLDDLDEAVCSLRDDARLLRQRLAAVGTAAVVSEIYAD